MFANRLTEMILLFYCSWILELGNMLVSVFGLLLLCFHFLVPCYISCTGKWDFGILYSLLLSLVGYYIAWRMVVEMQILDSSFWWKDAAEKWLWIVESIDKLVVKTQERVRLG